MRAVTLFLCLGVIASTVGVQLARSNGPFVHSPYAVGVHDMNGLGTSNPQNAVGAPDATYLSLGEPGAMVTLAFARGSEGVGDLDIRIGALSISAQARVDFLDEDLNLLQEDTPTFTTSINPQTITVAYDVSTYNKGYRYVRMYSLSATGFDLDAITASDYVGASEILDTDSDSLTDLQELYEGFNPANPLSPDVAYPDATVTAPSNNATVDGTVNVTVSASDDVGVAFVQFVIDDNTVLGTDYLAPYTVPLDTTLWGNGTHQLDAVVSDFSGNQHEAATIQIDVQN